MLKILSTYFFVIGLAMLHTGLSAQPVHCTVQNKKTYENIEGASVLFPTTGKRFSANQTGHFSFTRGDEDSLQLIVTAAGYIGDTIIITRATSQYRILLEPNAGSLGEVVITGTMRAVQRTSSPVPVEVYSPKFFLKNPSPTLFDALQMVNGVRPQLNCNVCSTGDIHINGLEGPYTMVLIDGMPIVSSLASVYGLSGIPNSLVERIEVVKGPASSLYGSEAIGGLINVITKAPAKAPILSMDISATSWSEFNTDLGIKYRLSPKLIGLLGINYFNYSDPKDKNNDNFTDVTLQQRISLFNKFQLIRPGNRAASMAVRYNYEDRWGGEMQWNKSFRGTDRVYGENIYTSRLEVIGNYQLPSVEKLVFSYSFNSHSQESAYGTTIFNALQKIAFGQLTWQKSLHKKHELLAGLVSRYTFYDDNTTATQDTASKINTPDRIFLPGIFVQDEISIDEKQLLLLGVRYDYDKRHGNIFTPRVAYKLSLSANDIIRVNAGTGFRVVNLFTEDHAALTGARAVVIKDKLEPEKSYNINLNYLKKLQTEYGWIHFDFSTWYTHFANRILPDYETNPNQIIYSNLDGFAVSKGMSLNTEMGFTNSLRVTLGATLMDVHIKQKDETGKIQKQRQLLTENWTGTWTASYTFRQPGITVDYTGNIYGPMLLPLLSPLDPREPISPVWSIQNLQLTKKISASFEVYGGIKNLLNWTPAKNARFIISRPHDPFDKQVKFDNRGQVIVTPENPHALTFDPNYVYAPNQGRRIFGGVRYVWK